MISIRRCITLLLCGAIGALFLVGGGGLYWAIRTVLTAQFDETLAAKAQALIVAADHDDDEIEIDFSVQDFAGFGSRAHGDFFEIRNARGRTLARSPSLGRDYLPARAFGSAPEFGGVRLPDQHPGRAIWQSFQLEGKKSDVLQVTVASSSVGLERSLRAIALVILIGGALGLILTVIIVRISLRLGLRPLDRLADQVRGIQVSRLHERLDPSSLPPELRPIAEKFNETLARLEEGFARERRFSSHAAHELRTPLAELKSMTELIARWPDEATPGHTAEMLSVIQETEALLDKLALLARAENGALPVSTAALDLQQAVASAVERVRSVAASRHLTISTEITGDTIVTDSTLWTAILNNLLSNAVHYAPSATEISVQVSPHHVMVRNSAPDLSPEDIPHLFERFWRKSQSRSDREHSGLGLSIVAACAELLGARCQATLDDRQLAVEVRWPTR